MSRIPNFTYKFGSKWQAVGSADRPLCALTWAASCLVRGEKLAGAARGMATDEQVHEIYQAVREQGVSTTNFGMWIDAHSGHTVERWRYPYPPQVEAYTLDDYQVKAIDSMTCAGHVFAMGCGLGKTITALHAAYRLTITRTNAPRRLWIACPLNAIPAWQEFLPWMTRNFDEVEIVSVDSLHKVQNLDSHPNSVIIFDEVHMLGSVTARRTKAAHTLRQAFTAGLCLTGTFLHGGVEKVLSMLDLAVPGAARFSSKWNCGDYFGCLVRKKLGARTVTSLAKPVQDRLEDFYQYLEPYCLSLNKDSLDVRAAIGDIAQQVIDVDIPFMPGESVDAAAVRVARAILKERGELPHMQEVAHVLSREGVSEKLAWLEPKVDGCDTQVVIFATYHETLDRIQEWIEARGETFVRVDGSVTGKNRKAAMDAFTGGARYFLGQTDAASVSMNLQAAYISVMFDSTWKAANYDQALARTARRGQDKQCYHFNLIANQFQRMVFSRVQRAADFDASVAEWQELRAVIQQQGVIP